MSAVTAVQETIQNLLDNPRTPGIKVTVSGGVTRPPMNPTAESLRLCAIVDDIAARLDIPFRWIATGGGSDANGHPRWRFRASAKRRSGLRGRSFGRSASRPCAPARSGRQRLDAQQHPDAGAVGGGCLGAGRPGRAATHCGARSQDVTQGSPRGGARLRGPRGCRTGGSPGPSRPGGRRGPALFRVDPGPRGSSFCAPRRSRPSCCGRSRPGPGLRAGAAGLRCAFRRSRPPRALAVFPLRHFPKLKRPAPRMLSALAFS